MKTSLYIDGFNFYHGCYKYQRQHCSPMDKWLDLRTLADRIAGADSQVHKIHYFTAYLHRSGRDPEQNIRQEIYLRAIEAIPGVELHFGKHIPVERNGLMQRPAPSDLGWPADNLVVVSTFEEKGSDVNLAVRLVDDAWAGEIDRAIVVSNDTDLISAIRAARRHIRVDVASPQGTLAKQLKKAADYSWCLDVSMFRECRMPIPQIGLDGAELFPPSSWMQDTWPGTSDAG